MDELQELMRRLNVSEEDAIKALLSSFSPNQPTAIRSSWLKSNYYGHSAPETHEIWQLFLDSDFHCAICRSQFRLSIDHMNGDPTDHQIENLRILCMDCNRGLSSRPTVDVDQKLRIYRAVVRYYAECGFFPSNKEIMRDAEIRQIGGARYFIEFLRTRLPEYELLD